MMARQASPTRLTTACVFLPLRVDDSSSAVMYPLTYFSYGGARETNHRCSAVHFYRRGIFPQRRRHLPQGNVDKTETMPHGYPEWGQHTGNGSIGHRSVRHLSANKTLLPGSLWRPRRHGEIQ